jgi:hypothetical protein
MRDRAEREGVSFWKCNRKRHLERRRHSFGEPGVRAGPDLNTCLNV